MTIRYLVSYDPRSTSFLFLTVHCRYQTLVSFRDPKGCSKQSSLLRRPVFISGVKVCSQSPSVDEDRLIVIIDTLIHSFAWSISILLLSPYLPRVRAQPLPSSFIGSTRLRLLDRWSKVIFQPKHDASPGPGSQSVTEGKIILRPLQTIARAPLPNARSYQTQSAGLLPSCTTSLHHARF